MNEDDALRAVEGMNGKQLNGRTLIVNEADQSNAANVLSLTSAQAIVGAKIVHVVQEETNLPSFHKGRFQRPFSFYSHSFIFFSSLLKSLPNTQKG